MIATATAHQDRSEPAAAACGRRRRTRRRRQRRAAPPRTARPQPGLPQAAQRCPGRSRSARQRKARRRFANRARTGRSSRASAFKAGIGTRARRPGRRHARANLAAVAEKGGRDKGGRDKAPRQRPLAPAIGDQCRPARRAIVRSIPIRRLPNWRRSRSSSPPIARIASAFRGESGPGGDPGRLVVRIGKARPHRRRKNTDRSRNGVAWSASVSTNGCGTRGW